MQPVVSTEKKRLVVVSVFLSILFCLLIIRFYQIQIVEGDKWANAALAQHQYVATEAYMRGSFYSNTSIKKGHPGGLQPFVVDVPKFHLFIDPDSIPDNVKEKMAAALFARLPNIDKRQEFHKKSRSRKIATWLDREKRIQIETWWNEFSKKEKIVRNALYFTAEYKRSYPFGPLLGAVLHTVQEDQLQPTGGLELLCNQYLKGKEGKRLIVRSPRHPLDTGKTLLAPQHGADVHLTINHYLQAIAESELAKGVQAVGAIAGWAVMIDPYTGEILALAQTPSFDPTHYSDYFNDPELIERTKVRAVTDCFEPGSIFKPITIAVAMKANEELTRQGKAPLFTTDEKVACSNGWFPGRSTPLKDGQRVHRFLNMEMAMQKSSNIYMAKMAHRIVEIMGESWYRKTLEEVFGFGQKTHIDLPAESTGLLPMPGKMHPNGRPEWSLSTPYSLAIGHNILSNSLQLARAYSILVNGGVTVQPHLIRKIVKEGKTLIDRTCIPKGKQVLSPTITNALSRSMRFVVKEGGTSRRAALPGYSAGGKSGTAEKIINGEYSKVNNIASFVGFAPAKNPRFVLVVSVDDPERKVIPGVGKQQMGGVSAAPIFREIAIRSLQYLGVTPDDMQGNDWACEVQQLKQLYNQWNL